MNAKQQFLANLSNDLQEIKNAGLFKEERIITSPQDTHINTKNHKNVINFCANNYLGLSNAKIAKDAAKASLDKWGFGLSSVRFICGTLEIHKILEKKLSNFLGFEDTMLFPSCFDANGGVFESLFNKEDAIISDSLNHASIIDGIRLCKAARYRYKNSDMADLEAKLQEATNARYKIIVTDGVFSMDGIIAPLKEICDLADKYNALLMVDDSHSVGVIGENGKGSHEYCGVMGRIDIMSGTLGKALGGASGGYISAKQEVIDILRQRARTSLFSNSLAPAIVSSTIAILDFLAKDKSIFVKLKENTKKFRDDMTEAGFDIVKGEHSIVPVMFYDAKIAKKFSEELLALGIYVIAFSYPVVPKEQARIRVQISAAHSNEDIDKAIEAFKEVKKKQQF